MSRSAMLHAGCRRALRLPAGPLFVRPCPPRRPSSTSFFFCFAARSSSFFPLFSVFPPSARTWRLRQRPDLLFGEEVCTEYLLFYTGNCIIDTGAAVGGKGKRIGRLGTMKEEKFKRIVIGSTVAAVVLLVFLIVFMIYQLVSVSQKRSLEQELIEQIALYEQMAEDKAGDISIYKDRVWLEMAARKLGLLGAGDVADLSSYIAAAEGLRFGEGEIVYEISCD